MAGAAPVSLADAGRAVEAFLEAIEEAQHMGRAGQVGSELDDVLRHAKEHLDVMDEELLDVDRQEQGDLFAAAPILRQKLERLRDELRGEMAH
jgi:hypothetical protein